jgi:hypothetical protein
MDKMFLRLEGSYDKLQGEIYQNELWLCRAVRRVAGVVTEGKDLEDCRSMFPVALNEMILTYKEIGKNFSWATL